MDGAEAIVEVFIAIPNGNDIYLNGFLLTGDLRLNMVCTHEGVLFRVSSPNIVPPAPPEATFSNLLGDTKNMGVMIDCMLSGERLLDFPSGTILKFHMPEHTAEPVPASVIIPEAPGQAAEIERPLIEKIRDDER